MPESRIISLHNLSALQWVRKDIVDLLQDASSKLERYIESQDDEYLEGVSRLIGEAVAIFELFTARGAALLCQELLTNLGAYRSLPAPDKNPYEFVSLMFEALEYLPDHLREIIKEGQDYPDLTLGTINRLRAWRKAPALQRSQIFLHDFPADNLYKEASNQAFMHERAGLQPVDPNKCNLIFRQSFLQWLRDPGDKECVFKVIYILQLLRDQNKNRRVKFFWWLCEIVFEAIYFDCLVVDKSLLQIASRIQKATTLIIETEEKGKPVSIPMELVREVLYCIAQARPETDSIKAIQEKFNLDSLIPTKGELARINRSLLSRRVANNQLKITRLLSDLTSFQNSIHLIANKIVIGLDRVPEHELAGFAISLDLIYRTLPPHLTWLGESGSDLLETLKEFKALLETPAPINSKLLERLLNELYQVCIATQARVDEINKSKPAELEDTQIVDSGDKDPQITDLAVYSEKKLVRIEVLFSKYLKNQDQRLLTEIENCITKIIRKLTLPPLNNLPPVFSVMLRWIHSLRNQSGLPSSAETETFSELLVLQQYAMAAVLGTRSGNIPDTINSSLRRAKEFDAWLKKGGSASSPDSPRQTQTLTSSALLNISQITQTSASSSTADITQTQTMDLPNSFTSVLDPDAVFIEKEFINEIDQVAEIFRTLLNSSLANSEGNFSDQDIESIIRELEILVGGGAMLGKNILSDCAQYIHDLFSTYQHTDMKEGLAVRGQLEHFVNLIPAMQQIIIGASESTDEMNQLVEQIKAQSIQMIEAMESREADSLRHQPDTSSGETSHLFNNIKPISENSFIATTPSQNLQKAQHSPPTSDIANTQGTPAETRADWTDSPAPENGMEQTLDYSSLARTIDAGMGADEPSAIDTAISNNTQHESAPSTLASKETPPSEQTSASTEVEIVNSEEVTMDAIDEIVDLIVEKDGVSTIVDVDELEACLQNISAIAPQSPIQYGFVSAISRMHRFSQESRAQTGESLQEFYQPSRVSALLDLVYAFMKNISSASTAQAVSEDLAFQFEKAYRTFSLQGEKSSTAPTVDEQPAETVETAANLSVGTDDQHQVHEQDHTTPDIQDQTDDSAALESTHSDASLALAIDEQPAETVETAANLSVGTDDQHQAHKQDHTTPDIQDQTDDSAALESTHSDASLALAIDDYSSASNEAESEIYIQLEQTAVPNSNDDHDATKRSQIDALGLQSDVENIENLTEKLFFNEAGKAPDPFSQISGFGEDNELTDHGDFSEGITGITGELEEKVLETFLDESRGIFEVLKLHIDEILRSNHNVEESHIREIKRQLHTLKGGLSVVGFRRLPAIIHSCESIIGMLDVADLRDFINDFFKNFIIWFSDSTEDIRYRRVDDIITSHQKKLNELLPLYQSRRSLPHQQSLDKISGLQSPSPALKESGQARTALKTSPAAEDETRTTGTPTMRRKSDPKTSGAEHIKVSGRNLDDLNSTLNELQSLSLAAKQLLAFESISIEEISALTVDFPDQFQKDKDRLKPNSPKLTQKAVTQMDNLLTVLKDLSVQRGELRNFIFSYEQQIARLRENIFQMSQVEFGSLENMLSLTARRACDVLGRKAKLIIDGAEINVEKSLLDRLSPALEHMIRNCVAHGIEDPKQRSQAGKPEIGEIRLTCVIENDQYKISVADDGRGLDTEKLIEEARRIDFEIPGKIDNEHLLQILSTHGISTSTHPTELSGRGIGMDAVAHITRLTGGRVDLKDSSSQGCCFELIVPVSALTVRIVRINICGLDYCLRADGAVSVQQIPAQRLRKLMTSSGVFRSDDQDYQLIDPATVIFGVDSREARRWQNTTSKNFQLILFAFDNDRHFAFVVDKTIAFSRQMMSSINPQLVDLEIYSEVCILENGSPFLVLSLESLIKKWNTFEFTVLKSKSGAASSANDDASHDTDDRKALLAPENSAGLRVLIVDDSLTVRKAITSALRNSDVRIKEIHTCPNNVQVISFLKTIHPDLVFLDVDDLHKHIFKLFDLVNSGQEYADILFMLMVSKERIERRLVNVGLNGIYKFLPKPFSFDELQQITRQLVNR